MLWNGNNRVHAAGSQANCSCTGWRGMLFVPERDERRFEPAAHRAQPVDAGMAGGTQSDQEARVVDARPAVVDGQFTIGPTGAAAPPSRSKTCSRWPAKRRREWPSCQ